MLYFLLLLYIIIPAFLIIFPIWYKFMNIFSSRTITV